MESIFRVGFNLKGDKSHHACDVTVEGFDFVKAREEVLDEFKDQRIVRALVLIDCVALTVMQGGTPNNTPTGPRYA